MTNLPLVSIGIPAYNATKHIGETVQSIFSQDYPNLKLFIQDNCSTDGTWQWLQQQAKEHPQISVEQNQHNLGMVGNFNRVANRAVGDFTAVISADDLLEPTFVSSCIAIFQQHPEVAIVTTNYHFYDGEKQWQKLIKLAPGLHQHFVGGVVIANNFSINFTMFRASALQQLRVRGNPFRTSLYTFDLDMWFRVAFSDLSIYYLPTPLGKFRVHSASASKSQFMHMFKQIFLVLMMHREAIKRSAPLAYRVKLARFTYRHIGHLLTGQSQDWRLMKAIVGELLR